VKYEEKGHILLLSSRVQPGNLKRCSYANGRVHLRIPEFARVVP